MRKRLVDPGSGSKSSKVTSVKPNSKAWKTAKNLAGGDVSRLKTNSDGSVTVNNKGKKR